MIKVSSRFLAVLMLAVVAFMGVMTDSVFAAGLVGRSVRTVEHIRRTVPSIEDLNGPLRRIVPPYLYDSPRTPPQDNQGLWPRLLLAPSQEGQPVVEPPKIRIRPPRYVVPLPE